MSTLDETKVYRQKQEGNSFRICRNCGKTRSDHHWSEEHKELLCEQPEPINTLQHFASRGDVVEYIGQELLYSLQADLLRMEGWESHHYTDEDRQTMRNRIADVEAVVPTLR